MENETIQISLEQLGRLTGKTPDELGSSLFENNEEGEKVLKSDATDTLSTLFTGKFQAVGNDFHKKGTKETWGKIESWVKSQDGDFDAKGRQGEDLLESFISYKAAKAAQSASKLTEEDLEKNELVKAFVERRTTKARETIEEFKQQLEAEKSRFQTSTKRSIARSKLLEALPAGTLGDGDERDVRLSVLYELLENRLDFIQMENGVITGLVDPKTNEPITDKELNPVRFDDWVQSFSPYKAPDRSAAARTPGGKTSHPGTSGDVRVTSKEDYERQLAKAKPEDRPALHNAYADFLEKNGL